LVGFGTIFLPSIETLMILSQGDFEKLPLAARSIILKDGEIFHVAWNTRLLREYPLCPSRAHCRPILPGRFSHCMKRPFTSDDLDDLGNTNRTSTDWKLSLGFTLVRMMALPSFLTRHIGIKAPTESRKPNVAPVEAPASRVDCKKKTARRKRGRTDFNLFPNPFGII
jgi:hypothetical protein